jgi:hypothetical protein
VAKQIAQFSLRQSRDGGVAARGSAKNPTAIDQQKIFRRFATRRKGSGAEDAARRRRETAFRSCFMSVTVQQCWRLDQAHAQVKAGDRVKIVVD